jgi:adenylate cyclase
VVFVESDQDLRFSYDDEDALVAVAGHLGLVMRLLQSVSDAAEPAEEAEISPLAAAELQGPELVVRHFAGNDSIFLGSDYLVKGVAGAILWALLNDYMHSGRREFSNRELRLDARIRLPDISDNLEARLVLLAKRLAERDAGLLMEKTGRGRFRLNVQRSVRLMDTPA